MEIRKQDMGEQIRRHCSLCQLRQGVTLGFFEEEIKACSCAGCPLWFFRFGKSPDAYIKEHGEKARELFDREKFAHTVLYF